MDILILTRGGSSYDRQCNGPPSTYCLDHGLMQFVRGIGGTDEGDVVYSNDDVIRKNTGGLGTPSSEHLLYMDTPVVLATNLHA